MLIRRGYWEFSYLFIPWNSHTYIFHHHRMHTHINLVHMEQIFDVVISIAWIQSPFYRQYCCVVQILLSRWRTFSGSWYALYISGMMSLVSLVRQRSFFSFTGAIICKNITTLCKLSYLGFYWMQKPWTCKQWFILNAQKNSSHAYNWKILLAKTDGCKSILSGGLYQSEKMYVNNSKKVFMSYMTRKL